MAKKVSGSKEGAPLREAVRECLERYFNDLEGQEVTGVYDMVLREVEPVVLRIVLEQSGGNQTRAADILGIHRATLRKKLRLYGIQ